MCGVFAFQAGGGGPRPWLRLPLYFAGKTFTYVFLGTLAGWAGAHALHGLVGAQAAVGVAVGALLVTAGWRLLRPAHALHGLVGAQAAVGVAVGALLVTAGWRLLRPARAPSRFATAWARIVAPVFRSVRRAHEVGGPFALGAATGALPCGVAYLAALQAAALADPLAGAASMAAFGAGTVPALAVAGLVGRGALARVGPARLRLVGALVVIATGLVAVARSAPSLFSSAGAPPCCCN
jgi:sulfite exporter TauE/SafE